MFFYLIRLLICFVAALNVSCVIALPEDLQTTADAKAAQLRLCYNRVYNGTASVFEDFLRGFRTSLYLHEIYASKKETGVPLTIFVGATLERLSSLEAQCRGYPGPLSAALYVPLIQKISVPNLIPENEQLLQQAAAHVKQLFDSLESPSPTPICSPTLLLLYEVVADSPLAALLPINSLRNAALLATSTPLVALVDVDLVPSTSLARDVLAPGGPSLPQLLRQAEQRTVWVLPAWETAKRLTLEEGTKVAEEAIQGDKAALKALVAQSRLHYFARYAYARGHNATRSSYWLDSNEPYKVEYEVNYEPWFIIGRRQILPYDVRFRGYGWNKVQQVAHVAHSNFTFWVAPNAWLVHRPHAKSSGQALYDGGHQDKAKQEIREWRGAKVPVSRLFHRRVFALRSEALRDMGKGVFKPVVDQQTKYCMEQLNWWGGLQGIRT